MDHPGRRNVDRVGGFEPIVAIAAPRRGSLPL
jgi:hypothetical protein